MKRRDVTKQRARRRDLREARALIRAWDEAESREGHASIDDLARSASSSDASTRLLALMIARRQIRAGDSPEDYFDFARKLIRDRDRNCRSQAVIVVGESVRMDPEAVWRIVKEFGNSADEDMRGLIGCALLEVLLDLNFEQYFALSQVEVREGRRRFLDTLSVCWFNKRGPNWERAQAWIQEVRGGR